MRKANLETIQIWIADPANAGWPIHTRIRLALQRLIVDGALPKGTPLPASRRLARSVGVSRGTVEVAYGQLQADGFIVRRVGSGSTVSEAFELACERGGRRRSVAGSGSGSRVCVRLHRNETAAVARAFVPGVPETRNFPIAQWERVHRQILKDHGTSLLGHGDPRGEEPLRRAIADYVNLERGGRVTPDRVVVLTSSQQAIWLCASVIFNPGDRIAVEDPGYHGARRAFSAALLDLIPVGVDDAGVLVSDIASLGRGVKGAYVVPSHQYPTGAALTLDRRHALIDWAKTHDAWIIEDDYDGEFHLLGRPTACVQGLDHFERTIYIGTFTKCIFPALRLAYLVLPRVLVERVVAARSSLDGFTASIPQLTLARFIEDGHFGAHLRAMRRVYIERREVLTSSLGSRLCGLVEVRRTIGGLQLPCILSGAISESESICAARKVGVDLVGLSTFYLNPTTESGWLMGFAACTPGEIRDAVSRLATVLF